MSPPDTNIKTQEKRHKGPLGGMALVVVFVAVLLFAWLAWLAWYGNDPGDTDDNATTPTATQQDDAATSGTSD